MRMTPPLSLKKGNNAIDENESALLRKLSAICEWRHQAQER